MAAYSALHALTVSLCIALTRAGSRHRQGGEGNCPSKCTDCPTKHACKTPTFRKARSGPGIDCMSRSTAERWGHAGLTQPGEMIDQRLTGDVQIAYTFAASQTSPKLHGLKSNAEFPRSNQSTMLVWKCWLFSLCNPNSARPPHASAHIFVEILNLYKCLHFHPIFIFPGWK